MVGKDKVGQNLENSETGVGMTVGHEEYKTRFI